MLTVSGVPAATNGPCTSWALTFSICWEPVVETAAPHAVRTNDDGRTHRPSQYACFMDTPCSVVLCSSVARTDSREPVRRNAICASKREARAGARRDELGYRVVSMRRTVTRSVTLVSLLLTSCGSSHRRVWSARGNDIAGSPSDVHSVAGRFDGYEVRRDCAPNTVVVLGIAGAFDATRLPAPPVNSLGRIVSTGTGLTCDHRVGEVLMVDDYRAVDGLVSQFARSVAGTEHSVAIYMSEQPVNF